MKKFFLIALGSFLTLFLLYFIYLTTQFYIKVKRGEVVDLSSGDFSEINLPNKNEASQKFDSTKIKNDEAPTLGSLSATLQIVEFADFTCPFSKQAFSVMRELLTKYPKQVSFTFRHFPLQDEAHKGGLEASEAAFCAGKQNKFWAYHDKLFLNQKNFTLEDLKSYAGQIGLDVPSFTKCLESALAEQKVGMDWFDGYSLGISGTPTFFVNGQKVEGAIPLIEWEKLIK
ncbi:MAG: DSBA oxidoreductase [Candidatus Magasanikbacteria bacterium GW2011_GWC2_40_17]|uniref:DSBA oxidoreductase n=1 Tax=Candidatus Magasanikbacteria bacterium GW2011_GWA2_42_32 TaxID=1619039 RepID=A0A0G1A8A1_9BACT|nr:MAG: DSBA oxidoreductase [Candidatus Magasanikbacteria bacterium GW2011_GWC2_40_17]KKS57282.1 MAG: DSBA oxidoreductase [Candidatus Magasanikbacteria bacterium GW2011_GWA2_42_32]OGH86170.1 MAG: hypothetical protein A2294_02865 [Candidatus Magasanikbacteria bacterium RIFOXYB2_FULL_38_10]